MPKWEAKEEKSAERTRACKGKSTGGTRTQTGAYGEREVRVAETGEGGGGAGAVEA